MTVLLLAGLLATVVVAYVLYPVVAGRWAPMEREVDELTEAQHRKRVALLALRDVEYDYHAGKLDDADYRKQKSQLSLEALTALDEEAGEWRTRFDASAHELGEREERARREEVEAEIAALRASIREGTVCTQCATPNPLESRYCGECGSALPGRERARRGT